MSTPAPTIALPEAWLSSDRMRLIRRAKTLSLLTIAWMMIEAGVAIVFALVAGSVALIGFGLDSLIELASASVILWLYTGSRSGSETAERRAQQLIAACFAMLAVYLGFDGVRTLLAGSHPETSWPGIAVSLAAIIIMPLLGRAKTRAAAQLRSAATAGDAAQLWLCAMAAAGVVVSMSANTALGWWWLDPIAGLGIAGLAVHEAREAWAGDVCAACAPIGLSRTSTGSARATIRAGCYERTTLR